MNRDLSRRLVRVEREHRVAAPSSLLADRPRDSGEADELLVRWQGIVSRGEGSISGSCLVLVSPGTIWRWSGRRGPVLRQECSMGPRRSRADR